MTCPTDDLLMQFLEGHLPSNTEAEVDAHLSGCALCEKRISSLNPLATKTGVALRSDAGSTNSSFPERIGKYRILKQLGQGGMGAVYLAFDERLQREVAFKVMLPKAAARDSAKARFLREARAAARIRSDHVVKIFEADEAAGVPYIAMELLHGKSLEDRMKEADPLNILDVLRIGRETALGLAAAHELGLIHRDIKPANIWLEGSSRRVKILDFGLARANEDPLASIEAESESFEGSATEQLTRTGAILGTPAYMSPEQARGEKIDQRSDLFNLGVVLYRMVTGRRPFSGESARANLIAIQSVNFPSPKDINPVLPEAVNVLIMRLLSKDPAGRPSSANETVRALSDLLVTASVQPLAAVPVEKSDPWSTLDTDLPTEMASSGQSDATVIAPPSAPRAARRRGRWKLPALVITALLTLAGATAVLISLRAPKGTLAIDSVDPAVEVTIKRDGKIIRERTRARELVLETGEYTIELADAKEGLMLSSDRFQIEKNSRAMVRVWLKEMVLAAKQKEVPSVPSKTEGARRAIVTLSQHLTLGFRTSTGEIITIEPGDPLPASPGELMVIGYRGGQLPHNITALTLQAIATERSVQEIRDPFLLMPWTEADFVKLAELPCRETLLHLGPPIPLTPKSATLLKRFPKLWNLGLLADEATDETLDAIAASSRLEELAARNLGKSGRVTGKGWKAICSHPLTSLQLQSPRGLDGAAGESIARIATLLHLLIYETEIDGDLSRALSRSPSLRYLTLRSCQFVRDGFKPLGAVSKLQSLDVAMCNVSDDELPVLSRLKALKSLNLIGTQVTRKAAIKLNADLPRCRISGPGVDVLEPIDSDWVISTWAVGLNRFKVVLRPAGGKEVEAISYEHLPDEPFALTAIARRTNDPFTDADCKRLLPLARLRHVASLTTPISDEELKQLLPLKDRLESILPLTLTDAGMPTIAQFKKKTRLEFIGAKLTASGLASLKELPALTHLAFVGTPISDEGATQLSQCRNLKEITLSQTKVDDAMIERIQKALPKCRIVWDGKAIEPKSK